MKTVVTGGAGFIGSHLVNRLVSQSYEVHVIDNLTTGDPGRLHSEAVLHVTDVGSDQAATYIRLLKPDIVFHLAAQADVQQSIKSPTADAYANIKGTINVLEACRAAKVRKIIFASSSEVYGNVAKDVLTEDDPVSPISFYSLSKLAAEQYIRLYKHFYGLEYTILRYSHVYGPRQTTNGEGGVISVFSEQMSSGLPLSIFGDGTQTRDFIYIKDVVEANLAVIDLGHSDTLHVSTGQCTSVNQIVDIVRGQFTGVIDVNYLPAKPGDIAHSCLDNSKIMSMLNWKPEYTIEQGLMETTRYWSVSSNNV
ncbi:NAD-dependent epimerase/dehydratase family protein [Paenibacillus sp. N3/727]|uniref:NAD-dependent epimerase/dehydratase family protein n=1 Tax=Paenibacillus sp. N3/727 TaxID=2925845 RepID=UPI001F53C07C|nr:NAD-dependent epimerase/dehydratase family protein [Paenibacillus sp. N3/727]UNK20943.1 NAD-dependent epimerase/dehydratase family protein [Paenibacillus sp. N3/727]